MFLRLHAIILLTCLALQCAGCSQASTPEPGDEAAFKAFLDQYVPGKLRDYQVPAAAVALVRDGQVVYQQAFGLRDLGLGQPANREDLWQVGSLSKSVTAWGVMKLVEQGKIDLDAPLQEYLDSWRLPPSEFDLSQVTVRRLLTHTAGLSITPYTGLPKGSNPPSLPEFFQLAAEDGKALYVQYPPGSSFRYSDNDYHLLQLLIEEVSGLPFPLYMQQEILGPLGMHDSSYDFSPQVESRMGWGYDSLFRVQDEYVYTQKAAAGLFTSARDLGIYAAAIMPGPAGEPVGRGVLQPHTVQQMLAAQADLAGFEKLLFKGDYGFGYIREQLPGGPTVYSHPGGNPGWIAELMIIPESGDGLVVFTNVAHGYVLFADLLEKWMHWLGNETPYVARLILFSGVVFDLLGVLLVAGGLALLISLVIKVARGRRILAMRNTFRPAWRGLLLVALPLLALAAWWVVLYPRYMISTPAQRDWLAAGLSLLLLAIAGYGITRRTGDSHFRK